VKLDGDTVFFPDPPPRVRQGPLEKPADRICAEFLGKINGGCHRTLPGKKIFSTIPEKITFAKGMAVFPLQNWAFSLYCQKLAGAD
jgi:hypothetical protein